MDERSAWKSVWIFNTNVMVMVCPVYLYSTQSDRQTDLVSAVVLLSGGVFCVSAERQRCGEAGWGDVTRPQRVCAGDSVRASHARERHCFQVLNIMQILYIFCCRFVLYFFLILLCILSILLAVYSKCGGCVDMFFIIIIASPEWVWIRRHRTLWGFWGLTSFSLTPSTKQEVCWTRTLQSYSRPHWASKCDINTHTRTHTLWDGFVMHWLPIFTFKDT